MKVMRQYEKYLSEGGIFIISMYGNKQPLWTELGYRYDSIQAGCMIQDEWSAKTWRIKCLRPPTGSEDLFPDVVFHEEATLLSPNNK